MRLLFVSGGCPAPPLGGAGLRLYHFLRGLAQRHEVHVLCCGTVRQEIEARAYLGASCAGLYCVAPPGTRGLSRRGLETVTSTAPDLALRFRGTAAPDALRKLAQTGRFDAVHLVGLEAAALAGDSLRDAARAGVRVVLDDLNAEYALQERAAREARDGPRGWAGSGYSWVQARKLRRYEAAVCARVDGVLAVSEDDAAALRRLRPSVRPVIVPNGVDAARYDPALLTGLGGRAPLRPGGPVLLFTGTMDFRPNADAMEWFVREALPIIRGEIPDVRLAVVGRNPPERVRRLAGPQVLVTGAVPDDLPYFAAATLFVLPMRFGGGSRLKLLQALSCGLPVVTTRAGAAGLPVVEGEHALYGESAVGFARSVLSLLREPGAAARLAVAGRALAVRFDWSAVVPRLEGFYESLLAGRPAWALSKGGPDGPRS